MNRTFDLVCAAVTAAALALGATIAAIGTAAAQTTIDSLPAVPTFPLPDPGTTASNLMITQGGNAYRINPLQLGHVFQGNCANLTAPFANELCWNTTTNPATLQVYQSGAWANFPNVAGFAPLASPALTGTPTAPTAPTGTATTQIATTAFVANATRLPLTGNITLYVAANGSDTNNNCETAATPCATAQNAYNYALANFDTRGYTVTIHLADGSYSSGLVIASKLIGQTAPNQLIIQGDTSNASLVTINAAAPAPQTTLTGAIVVADGAEAMVEYLAVQSTGSGLLSVRHADLIYTGIDFLSAGTAGVNVVGQATAVATGQAIEVISASMPAYLSANAGSVINTCTLSGPCSISCANNPAFSTAFAAASDNSVIYAQSMNFSCTGATGTRYNAGANSTIDTGGGGASYLPGNAAGTTSNNGVYD
jgi:hypothetical protein